MLPAIEVYTDGSCINNPGPGGTGFIIRYWEENENTSNPIQKEETQSQGFRISTNNRMEIRAALDALERVITLIETGVIKDSLLIQLKSDSQYFCNAVNMNWIKNWSANNWMTSGFKGSAPKPVKNKDLWLRLIDIQAKLNTMTVNLAIEHVKGHNGHEFNERCDQLANNAARGTTFIPDEGYEASKA